MSRLDARFPSVTPNDPPSSAQPIPSGSNSGATRRPMASEVGRCDLSHATFGRGEFAQLVNVVLASGITELCLDDCQLSDADAQAVAALIGANSPLKQLRLGDNHFGQATAQRIGDALRLNANLELLDLSGNELDLTAFVEILSPLCTPVDVRVSAFVEPANKTLSTLLLGGNTGMFTALGEGQQDRYKHAAAAHQLAVLGAAPHLGHLDLSGIDLPVARRPSLEVPTMPLTGTVASTAMETAVAKAKTQATAKKRTLYANSSSLRERQTQFKNVPKPQPRNEVTARKAAEGAQASFAPLKPAPQQTVDAKTAASCIGVINELIKAHGPADVEPTPMSIDPAFRRFVETAGSAVDPNPVPPGPTTAASTQPQSSGSSVQKAAPVASEFARFVETSNATETLSAELPRFDSSLPQTVSITPEFDRFVETTNAATNTHTTPLVPQSFTAWLRTTDGAHVGFEQLKKENPTALPTIQAYFEGPSPVFGLSSKGAIVCNRGFGKVWELGQKIAWLSSYEMHSALIRISAAAADFVLPTSVSDAVALLYGSVLALSNDQAKSTKLDASVNQVFANVIEAAGKTNVQPDHVAKLKQFLAAAAT